jgi:hypothetical protein
MYIIKKGEDIMKKILYIISVILVIPCIIYYTSKFYIYKELIFTSNYLAPFTNIMCLILGVFIICLLLFIKINKLQKIIDKYYYYETKQIQNNRECILDIGEKINNAKK